MTTLQPHGVAPLRLAPVSGNEALLDAQKHLFWVPPENFRPRSPQKTSFPWVPTWRVEYPHGFSTIPMGSHPCAWPRSKATLRSYPCSSIVRTPPTLVPIVSLKTSFPRIPTYPAGYPHDPSTTPMGLHPCAWPLSLATKRCRMPKNTYSGSHRRTFAQGLPKKRVFPGYPPGGSSTHMVPLQYPLENFRSRSPLRRFFPGYPPGWSSTHMVPLQYLWGRTPVLGPVLRLHWGHTLAHP